MRVLPGAAALLLCAGSASADEVELRNGRVLEGEVIGETDADVTVRVEGGQVTFEKRLVSAIRKGPTAAAAAPAETAKAPSPAPFSGVAPAREDWAILWSPERRAGWRHTQAGDSDAGTTFEEETAFFGEKGEPGETMRLVEEAGPGLAPVSFLYRESAGGREMTRTGRVEAGRLRVETWSAGARSSADHPLPDGFRLPLAARAFVLREYDRLPGGWRGTTYDPRTGEFVVLALRCRRTERVLWEGEAVEVCVLERERGGVLEEERVARDGRVLAADLNGPGLTAVGSTRSRVEALRAVPEAEASAEERRARTVFVAPEDGFRIFKPGIAWDFVPPADRGAATRVTVKDASGFAFVSVASEEAPTGEEPPPAALGAALERRLRAGSAELEKMEDGFGEAGGRPAYRILCDALVKGDRVRTLAWTFLHRGRVWTLTATCPRGVWDEARPYLQRILDGFEWL